MAFERAEIKMKVKFTAVAERVWSQKGSLWMREGNNQGAAEKWGLETLSILAGHQYTGKGSYGSKDIYLIKY